MLGGQTAFRKGLWARAKEPCANLKRGGDASAGGQAVGRDPLSAGDAAFVLMVDGALLRSVETVLPGHKTIAIEREGSEDGGCSAEN